MMTAHNIAENYAHLQRRIAKAEHATGRTDGSVALTAVTKRQTPDALKTALDCGQRLFGENRVQEAQDHWQDLRPHYSDLRLHLIGPLQTNKVRDALTLFDCVETLDREKLARALQEEMGRQGHGLPCFIQVNTGEEPQKAGIAPRELPDFLNFCRCDCGLEIAGLMCIPPVDDPPALHFALLKKLGDRHQLKNLSMGMSHDFEKAIALGATHVRIGTALFGERLREG